MNRSVVIIGYGGHGRVVHSALRAANIPVVAATDLHPAPPAASGGIEILTDDALIDRLGPHEVILVAGVGSIWPCCRDSARRQSIAKFMERGYRFMGFRHPFSWAADDCQVAETAQLHAGCIVQSGAVVGDFTIVNTRAAIDHDCSVADFCHIGPGATLSGNVRVGTGSHLGTGCTVIQGITIGEQCLIAAGATVVHDVPDGEYVRGTPARAFTVRNR